MFTFGQEWNKFALYSSHSEIHDPEFQIISTEPKRNQMAYPLGFYYKCTKNFPGSVLDRYYLSKFVMVGLHLLIHLSNLRG